MGQRHGRTGQNGTEIVRDRKGQNDTQAVRDKTGQGRVRTGHDGTETARRIRTDTKHFGTWVGRGNLGRKRIEQNVVGHVRARVRDRTRTGR